MAAVARSTNSETAGEFTPSSTSSGGTGQECSPLIPRGSLDVVMTDTLVVRSTIALTTLAAASITCSQLSITIRRRRPDSASNTLSMTLIPATGVTPRAVATVAATADASATGASSTNHAPSAKCGVNSAAT